MKCSLSLVVLFVGLVAAQDWELAEDCDVEACQLPDCRCSNTQIPGNLQPRDTPQFVLLTFDDAVNVLNIVTYRRLLDGRVNINQCPVGSTFYVSHEYTNYQAVNELYNKGHEIALHSISHQTPQDYWRDATVEDMRREFGDQKAQMAHFANIPYNQMHGVRIPFLQMTGNATFIVMDEVGLTYDCSWPTINHINPGLWPYSLRFASTQDCVIPPCPTASIPSTWVLPIVTWRDNSDLPCSFVDSCFSVPAFTDEEGWFRFIVTNFERHYMGNRAPFGFFVHEWFVSTYPAIEAALVRFLDMVNNLHDTYMVTSKEVIDWVRNPVPVDQYRQQPCKTFTPTTCPVTTCGPLTAEHNGLDYWMTICNTCPANYPWLGNPLGL